MVIQFILLMGRAPATEIERPIGLSGLVVVGWSTLPQRV